MIPSNKAQAHIEMILATVLFIGFLVFVFAFLNSSLKTTQEIPTEKIQKAILERAQQEVGKLSVVLGDSNKACFNLNDVEDEYGTDLRFIQDPINPKRFTIYYGEFLNNNVLINCNNEDEDFLFGAYLEEKIVIEDNIVLIVEEYKDDYSSLKQNLGVENFAFEFRDENNQIIDDLSVRGKIPDNVDIVSKDFPIRVINADALMTNRILNIKAWR